MSIHSSYFMRKVTQWILSVLTGMIGCLNYSFNLVNTTGSKHMYDTFYTFLMIFNFSSVSITSVSFIPVSLLILLIVNSAAYSLVKL